MVAIADQEGGVVKLPLQGPIHLPLSVLKRGEITGKDLIEVPLEVDLIGSAGRVSQVPESSPRRKMLRDKGRVCTSYSSDTGVQRLKCMKGREPAKRCYWNLEEEMAKLIEKRVALGHDFKARHKAPDLEAKTKRIGNQEDINSSGIEGGIHGGIHGGSSSQSGWSLEMEVAKILEVGAALGFDFNGNEGEIGEILSRREKEDEDRLAAMENR